MLRKIILALLFTGAALHAGDTRSHAWAPLDLAEIEKVRADVSARVTRNFEILISGPWILATDLDRRSAQAVMKDVVNGAAVRVREQFFPRAKYTRPIVLYVLKDTTSYMNWSHRLFQETPPTALGYYDRREGYILTHADRGFGPLLHEMVHVMAEADFPGIPPWLNEGLGSLFEEYVQSGDEVEGVVNWRLTRFKEEILAQRPVPLRTLLSLDRAMLYGDKTLSYYTALRHLMLWLQEQDKALPFYQALRDSKNADPAGTLCAVLGNRKTLEQAESELRQWALAQRLTAVRSGPTLKGSSRNFR